MQIGGRGVRGVAGVAVVALVTGCASGPPPRPLADRMADLKGRTLTAMTYEATPLKVTLKENAVGAAILAGFIPIIGGLAGQSLAESAGREVMAKAGLSDPSLAKALVNESWCYFSSDADKTTAPTFEQLMAEDGARLRKEMADGIAKCGDELIAELLPK